MLYKRGNIWWSYVYQDGVRHPKSTNTGNRRIAETIDRQHKEELALKRHCLPQLNREMELGELYARFVAEGDVKPHHLDRAKHFLPFFAEMPIGQITKNDIIRYRKYRHEEHRTKHEKRANDRDANRKETVSLKLLSDATINRDASVVRHLLYWATDEGFIAANPLARIRLARERRKRRPVMPVTEEMKLLAACSDHLEDIVVMALDTGMRKGELLNQLSEHIDYDRRVLSVSHSKTPEGEMREIPLTKRVFKRLSTARKSSGPLFTYVAEGHEKKEGDEDKRKRGRPIRSIKTGWMGALRRAEIGHYRFHDLRHTFNSRLVEAGVIADVRKELMGHCAGGDVHSIYSHVELPLLREAIAKLEAWHNKQTLTIQPDQGGSIDASIPSA